MRKEKRGEEAGGGRHTLGGGGGGSKYLSWMLRSYPGMVLFFDPRTIYSSLTTGCFVQR